MYDHNVSACVCVRSCFRLCMCVCVHACLCACMCLCDLFRICHWHDNDPSGSRSSFWLVSHSFPVTHPHTHAHTHTRTAGRLISLLLRKEHSDGHGNQSPDLASNGFWKGFGYVHVFFACVFRTLSRSPSLSLSISLFIPLSLSLSLSLSQAFILSVNSSLSI